MNDQRAKIEPADRCLVCGSALSGCQCSAAQSGSDCAFKGWLGLTVNQYEILSLLGKGGMGVVYCARDLRLSVLRALKVLEEPGCNKNSSEQALQRFLAEARSVSSLSHPNIIACHDYGEGPDGTPYVVMDLLDGQTLADLIESGESLELSRVVSIMLQVCKGLEHAHSKGILHRDIKPSNIMLANDETGSQTVKILDFGIAKVIGTDPNRRQRLTKTGEIIGSPSYMSPEQGQGYEVDERSDIYSFGCVFYELLKGRVPFEGANTVKTILDHIFQEPPPLTLRSGTKIPADLENLVMRCLEKDPEDRYQKVGELRLDLEKIKSGESVIDDGLVSRRARKLALKIGKVLPGLVLGTAAFLILGMAYFAFERFSRPPLPGKEESYFQRAKACKKAQKYEAAVDEISQAIKLNGKESSYYYLRGSSYAMLHKHQAAIDDYTKVLEMDPKNAEAYKSRKECYSELGLFQKAIDDLSKALVLKPDDALSYRGRAWLYEKLACHQKAIDDYSKAVDLEPNNADAYMSRGDCYCALGQFRKANNDFGKAIELKPGDAEAYNRRGWTFCELAEYQKAVQDADKAISLDRRLAAAYDTRGFACNQLGQYKRALADYARSVGLDDKAGVVYFHRSQTYEKLGKKDLSKQDRETAARLGYKPEKAENMTQSAVVQR